MAELVPTYHEEMLKLLECPVCFEIMYPPIYQCSNGHIICSKCKPKMVSKRCPTCNVVNKDNSIRCLHLEKFLAFTRLRCCHHTVGCEELVLYEEKQEHEKNQCKFRPIPCPYSTIECKFTDNIFKLVGHLESCHKVEAVDRFDDIYIRITQEDLFMKENDSKILGVYRSNFPCRMFLVQLEFFDRGGFEFYLLYITLVGDEEEAKQCICHFYISNGTTAITWEGMPYSLLNTNKHVIESGNGLLLCKSTSIIMDVTRLLQFKVHLPSYNPEARILVGAVATANASAWAVIALAADGHFLGSWAGYEKSMTQFRVKCFALMKAATICLEHKWSSVSICSDCRRTIELLKSPNEAIIAMKDEEGDILRWVKEKMEQNFDHFSYIVTGSSPLADSLAKYTLTMKRNLVCMDTMGPKCISHLVIN